MTPIWSGVRRCSTRAAVRAPVMKDFVGWNSDMQAARRFTELVDTKADSRLGGIVARKGDDVLRLLKELEAEGFAIGENCFIAATEHCAAHALKREAEDVIQLLSRRGLTTPRACLQHLLTAYAKTGDAREMRACWAEMERRGFAPDAATFAALIMGLKAYAYVTEAHGGAAGVEAAAAARQAAAELFRTMDTAHGVQVTPRVANIAIPVLPVDEAFAWARRRDLFPNDDPDDDTLCALMESCGVGGRVDLVQDLWKRADRSSEEATRRYLVELARAGKMRAALDAFASSPLRSTSLKVRVIVLCGRAASKRACDTPLPTLASIADQIFGSLPRPLQQSRTLQHSMHLLHPGSKQFKSDYKVLVPEGWSEQQGTTLA